MRYKFLSGLVFVFILFCCSGQVSNSALHLDSANHQTKTDSIIFKYNFENENNVQLSVTNSGQYLRNEYNPEGGLISVTQVQILIFSDTLITFPISSEGQLVQQMEIIQRLSYLRHGSYQEFRERRDLSVFGLYLNGVKHGTWTYYKNDKEIDHVDIFDNGILIESR